MKKLTLTILKVTKGYIAYSCFGTMISFPWFYCDYYKDRYPRRIVRSASDSFLFGFMWPVNFFQLAYVCCHQISDMPIFYTAVQWNKKT